MNISARNALKGKITRIVPGAVNTEVIVELTNGVEVVTIITKQSAERLNFADGKEVYALIKASDVMIAIDQGLSSEGAKKTATTHDFILTARSRMASALLQ